MPTSLPCSRQSIALLPATLGALLLFAAGASASAPVHRHAQPVAKIARSAEEREARLQERASRAAEREQARGERQAAREQRRSEREASRADKRAARPANCRVTLGSSAAEITAGEAVTLSGKVSCPDESAAAAQSGAQTEASAQHVTLAQASIGIGGRSFAAPQPVAVKADGSFELPPQTLTQNTVFKVHVGRHGAHVAVKVAPLVTLSVSPLPTASSTRADGAARLSRHSRASFSGTVTPAGGSGRVALQVQYPADGEAWRTVAFSAINPDGSYSLARSFRIGGEASVRVIAHLRGTNAPGISEAVSYAIPQAQNPELTLSPSADPILYGQSVTLTGTAAGTPGQTVTLLGRTDAGAFSTLASSTTDASGNYSFETSPLSDTTYVVSDAATRSTPLFVGVRYGVSLDSPPSTVAAGSPLTVTGTIAPGHAGQQVYLERANALDSGYHLVTSAAVNADSSFTLTHAFADSAGTAVKLRVRVSRDPQLQRGLSEPFTVQVTAPAPAEPPAS